MAIFGYLFGIQTSRIAMVMFITDMFDMTDMPMLLLKWFPRLPQFPPTIKFRSHLGFLEVSGVTLKYNVACSRYIKQYRLQFLTGI